MIGGRGNQPLRAHSRLLIRRIAEIPVTDRFELRVIGIEAAGDVVDWPIVAAPTCATAGRLAGWTAGPQPKRVTQAWIERTVPTLKPQAFALVLEALPDRNWSDAELNQRVLPHRHACE